MRPIAFTPNRKGARGAHRALIALDPTHPANRPIISLSVGDLPREQQLTCDPPSTEATAFIVNSTDKVEGAMAPPTHLSSGSPTSTSSVSARSDDYLFSIYYANFHASHPVLLPWNLFEQTSLPSYLKQVVKLIAAHFTTTVSSTTYRHNIVETVLEQASTVEKAQVFFLLSIVLHSRTEHVEGHC